MRNTVSLRDKYVTKATRGDRLATDYKAINTLIINIVTTFSDNATVFSIFICPYIKGCVFFKGKFWKLDFVACRVIIEKLIYLFIYIEINTPIFTLFFLRDILTRHLKKASRRDKVAGAYGI
jgi:hypothetical protein